MRFSYPTQAELYLPKTDRIGIKSIFIAGCAEQLIGLGGINYLGILFPDFVSAKGLVPGFVVVGSIFYQPYFLNTQVVANHGVKSTCVGIGAGGVFGGGYTKLIVLDIIRSAVVSYFACLRKRFGLESKIVGQGNQSFDVVDFKLNAVERDRLDGFRFEHRSGAPRMADAKPGLHAVAIVLTVALGTFFPGGIVADGVLGAGRSVLHAVNAVFKAYGIFDSSFTKGHLVFLGRRESVFGGFIPAVVDAIEIGWPVASSPGRGGGVTLDGEFIKPVFEVLPKV